MADEFEGIWLGEDLPSVALHGTMFTNSANRYEIPSVLVEIKATMKVSEPVSGTVMRHRELKRANHDRVRVWAPEEWSEEEIFAVLDAPPEW